MDVETEMQVDLKAQLKAYDKLEQQKKDRRATAGRFFKWAGSIISGVILIAAGWYFAQG